MQTSREKSFSAVQFIIECERFQRFNILYSPRWRFLCPLSQEQCDIDVNKSLAVYYARVLKKTQPPARQHARDNTIHGHYRGGSSFILHLKRIE